MNLIEICLFFIFKISILIKFLKFLIFETNFHIYIKIQPYYFNGI